MSYLLGTLSAFNRAYGEAEPGSTGDVWDVHIIGEPLIPPVVCMIMRYKDKQLISRKSHICGLNLKVNLQSVAKKLISEDYHMTF